VSDPAAFKVRSPVVVVLLTIVTFGIYSFYWVYQIGREMKEYNDSGLGPAVNLLLAVLSIFAGVTGIVLLFTIPNDVRATYEKAGRSTNISALAAFWNLIPLVGSIIWIVKIQHRLNTLWESPSPAVA
jgi:glucan phosphoethanolaminetransferase (alkaline phosphatase superfamily)